MPNILFFDAIAEADAGRVGGKGLSLGKTANAGLPVPPGFVVTTETYRRLADRGARSDPGFIRALQDAYRDLGGGPVAVRSSATAEDAADTSFAGQQETILGVEGEDALINAVERCWRSLHIERAVAYRAKQGVDAAGLGMAVVVQQLVPAEAAGVLFTRDPLDPDGKRMLAEGSWGLGEAVVSGRVQPDRFKLDRESGVVLEKHLGLKSIRITKSGEEHVPAAEQQEFCLSDTALSQLAELGRKVEDFYRDPRDIEWAFADGKVYLLQARPITVAGAAERERVRQQVIADLKSKADPKGTVWVRYNLSEVLPEPTPMTWSVVRRLLAADGGFGAMNRDLGAKPDPTLGSLSAFDLVASRPMMNLSRLPRMQFERPPFEYPIGLYKSDPRKALDPKPALNPLAGRGCLLGFFAMPGTILKLTRQKNAIQRQAATFGTEFTQAARGFAALAKTGLAIDWASLDPPALVRVFETWVEGTLVQFSRESLKATVFADLAWSGLFETLKPKLGDERARVAVGELSLRRKPPEGADLADGIRDLAAGAIDRTTFLERFGHRGTNEMELSQSRWSEVPEELSKLVVGTKGLATPAAPVESNWEKIADEAKLGGPARSIPGTSRASPHLPRSPRSRQTLPPDGLCSDPPGARRTRPALRLERRHLLPYPGRFRRSPRG